MNERRRRTVASGACGPLCATSRGFTGLQSPLPPLPRSTISIRAAGRPARHFVPLGQLKSCRRAYTVNYRPPEPFSRRRDFWHNNTACIQSAGVFNRTVLGTESQEVSDVFQTVGVWDVQGGRAHSPVAFFHSPSCFGAFEPCCKLHVISTARTPIYQLKPQDGVFFLSQSVHWQSLAWVRVFPPWESVEKLLQSVAETATFGFIESICKSMPQQSTRHREFFLFYIRRPEFSSLYFPWLLFARAQRLLHFGHFNLAFSFHLH